MPQKPEIDDWEPVDDWQPVDDWEPVEQKQEPGLLEQWNNSWVNKPLVDIAPQGKHFAEMLTEPQLSDADHPYRAMAKGFVGGVGEGLANVASGFTTPLNLATMTAGGIAGGAAKAGLSKIAQTALAGEKALSVPVVATGAMHTFGEDRTPTERGFGVAEMAGGLAGLGAKLPEIKPGVSHTPIPEKTSFIEPTAKLAPSPLESPNESLPHEITLRQPIHAKIAKYRQMGYESAGVNEDGFPRMVLKSVIDKIESPEPKTHYTEPSLFGDDEIIFDEEITVKNPSASAIKRIQDQGYEMVEVSDDGTVATFKPIKEQEMSVPNQPNLPHEFQPDMPYSGPERRTGNQELAPGMPERRMGDERLLRPSDKLIPNARQDQLLGILGGKQNLKNIEPNSMMPEADLFGPQEMKVKNVREGQGGLENVAVGGADPRVLDVLGSSLYTKPRPVVTMKELLQNAVDEHRISGTKSPIRVLVRDSIPNPQTNELTNAITVRDRGRGLNPDEMYTVLTDVGKTGKAGIDSASGGFGFAKAAPFLGGKYVEVTSIVMNEAGQKVKFEFKGNPTELKNQVKGVALNRKVVDPKTPTGLEVTTYFPKEQGIYGAEEIAKNMATLAKKNGPEVWLASHSMGGHLGEETSNRAFLDNPSDEFNSQGNQPFYVKQYQGKGLPKIQGQLETPGAKIDLRYDNPKAGAEAAGYDIHYMNKGLYQQSDYGSYGNEPVPNVPHSIVADISAIVEEGTEGYPFGANREQVDRSVSNAIDQWVNDNIKSGAQRSRVAAIQEKYDSIKTIQGSKTLLYDKGEKFTPDELELITTHPEFQRGIQAIEEANKELLAIADNLGWVQGGNPAADWVPSKRLKKFGVLFQGPENGSTTLGIHIPRPDDLNDSAILINVMELLNQASRSKHFSNALSTSLYATLTHELGHIPGGGHDTGFAYRHAQLLERLGREDTVHILDKLYEAFNDGNGNISPDVSDLLSIYNESRRRRTSKDDTLLSTGVSSIRRTNPNTGEGPNAQGANAGKNQPSPLTEAYNFSRGMLASMDLSAPLRQGLPLMLHKEWRDAIGPMLKALGPEESYKAVIKSIEEKPIFQRRVNTKTGKILPSYAEEVGLKLTDLHKSLGNREEATMSNWAEKVPGVRRSNQAYNAFLNKLRADTFEKLVNQARDIAGDSIEQNPYRNKQLASEIADYVMTATGRGPLKIAVPTLARDASGKLRLGMKEKSFEAAGEILTGTLFSPRLFTSRIRMLNPGTYIMASPFVRKQYMKSFLTTAAAWGTMTGLAALAGAEVSGDTNSSDFGKIKIGNTRLDPAGGFQQFLVAASRLLTGKTTSSATGEERTLGEGFQAETGTDVGERFMVNKLHPVLKFAYDLWDASEYKPFHLGDRVAQMFIPLIIQDVYELAKSDPTLLPLIAPIGLGMGSQTYEAGETSGKIVPEDMDYQLTTAPTKPMYDWFTGQ